MADLQLHAATTFGLEAIAARELEGLGYAATITSAGRVSFVGGPEAIARANLWLRTADRVLVEVGRFPAGDFGELFDGVAALPWEQWISPHAAFPVRGRSARSVLSSVPACQRIAKKAIVDHLLAAHGVAELPEDGHPVPVEVALADDVAILTVDTTGPGLNRRGYRPIAGKAPLKETLAAALVMLSFWKPERQLLDPFCGTGTIPIEAALIGRNLAPGLQRHFAAERWPAVLPRAWSTAREEALDQMKPPLPVRIIGTDSHAGALSLARRNAEAAGVAEDVHFQQQDFADTASRKGFGVLICNPPYGVRLGEQQEVAALYASMPQVFRRLRSWSFYVLAADREFETHMGRPADRRRKLYNGPLECTLYQFYGPRPGETVQPEPGQLVPGPAAEPPPPSSTAEPTASAEPSASVAPSPPSAAAPLAAPAFGGVSEHALEQARALRNRLTKRARHLRRWPARGVTCYRLYDRDIPAVPLAVDWYEGRLHIAEYERPHERTVAQQGDWLDLMVATARDALKVAPQDVYLKRRERQRGHEQYERFGDGGRTLKVHEGGLVFAVNLSDYLDTGLFLDHRNTRARVKEESHGGRFLNLFGYTAAFTVYAAAGGARRTVTVDRSNTYLQWARYNLRLNGFDGPPHHLIRADALTFLRDHPPGPAYDLAVVDPPTFSNSKSLEQDWDVQRQHVELLRRVADLMSPGGVIYFSTNSRRFRLDADALESLQPTDISSQTVPEDFRNRRIHRCWRLVVDPG